MKAAITGTPEKFELISPVKNKSAVVFGLVLLTGLASALSSFLIFYFAGFSRGTSIAAGIVLYISFLIVKFALWNLAGKEIINYNGKKITHQFDYKYFRSNPRTLNGKITRITLTEFLGEPEIQPGENENHLLDNPARSLYPEVVFHIGENRVTTTTKAPHEMIEQFFNIKLEHC